MMDSLDLSARIKSALKRANLTSEVELLSMSVCEIANRTDLTHSDVNELLNLVASSLQLPINCATAAQCSPSTKLSTGCVHLNQFLHGGILCHGITEIAGESAAGKTQIGLQLCLTVQQPTTCGGLGGGAVYICTEDSFPSKRLSQLIKTFRVSPSIEILPDHNYTDEIFVEHMPDTERLSDCLDNRLPPLLASRRVKLLVIDSIAALFRAEFGAAEGVTRAQLLQKCGNKLHRLNTEYGVAVICINQVTARINNTDTTVVPALGLSWANMVTTRLLVTRTNHMTPRDGIDAVVRKMSIEFAPHLPCSSCYFVVDRSGVHGL